MTTEIQSEVYDEEQVDNIEMRSNNTEQGRDSIIPFGTFNSNVFTLELLSG